MGELKITDGQQFRSFRCHSSWGDTITPPQPIPKPEVPEGCGSSYMSYEAG